LILLEITFLELQKLTVLKVYSFYEGDPVT
jgi:hypothetical protein